MDRALSPTEVLTQLWDDAGADPSALEHIALDGHDPYLPSTFRVGTIALASIGAAALAASEIWRLRSGQTQTVAVDIRAACATFRSERYLTVNDKGLGLWDPIAGFYETADGRWIQLHTNFPHHRAGVVKLLGCGDNREAVADAIRERDALELEQALIDAALCAAAIRTPAEWAEHPQAHAIAAEPLIKTSHFAGSRPEPLPKGSRPLDGVKVLDLSRIIAGPVAGRTLAEHGATVLRVDAEHLPNVHSLTIDTGRGKRSTFLDLRTDEGRGTFKRLVRDADVVLQAYRPGALDRLGLSKEVLSEARPGLIHLSLNAFGFSGPWASRRGYDSLVQSTTGIAVQETLAANASSPRHLPAQALDHATGFLAAFAIMNALRDRAQRGGTTHIDVALANTGRWLSSLGPVDGIECADLNRQDIADLLTESQSDFGRLSYLTPAAKLSMTPGGWSTPPPALGAHRAVW
ncbi:MAG: CoA transferase [Gammaproteobacteria bacterium]|nr:CoA transferase [Gammaproteobacteria bacterium]